MFLLIDGGVAQLKLIEVLDPSISNFELFLSKNSLAKVDWTNDEKILSATGKINPTLTGWPNDVIYDSEMRRIDLDQKALDFLKAIQRFPRNPLASLGLCGSESLIAATARDLQNKKVLLLYRP